MGVVLRITSSEWKAGATPAVSRWVRDMGYSTMALESKLTKSKHSSGCRTARWPHIPPRPARCQTAKIDSISSSDSVDRVSMRKCDMNYRDHTSMKR